MTFMISDGERSIMQLNVSETDTTVLRTESGNRIEGVSLLDTLGLINLSIRDGLTVDAYP